MAYSEQDIKERVDELIADIESELDKGPFNWSLDAYRDIKRDFITADVFEPLTEEYFGEYESDEDRRADIIYYFERAARNIAQELRYNRRFIYETADASRVTFISAEAIEFYKKNSHECDEVATFYEIDMDDENGVFSANYHVMSNRIEDLSLIHI